MAGELSNNSPRNRTMTSTSSTSVDSFRLQSSASGSSSRTPLAGPASQTPYLSREVALQAAAGDTMKALEAVLGERNMLSQQNTQLWKLIEKQRSGYANVLRELERVRIERDQARGRRGTAPTTSSNNQSESELSTTTPRKPVPSRHASDDGSASPIKQKARHRELSGSRSHERFVKPSTDSTTSSLASLNQQASASSSALSNTSDVPMPWDNCSSNTNTQPLQISQKDRPSFSHSTVTNGDSISIHPPEIVQPTTETSTPSVKEPSSQSLTASNTLIPPPRNKSFRESTISLPSEARQYISNMADSPQQSPHPFSSSRSSSPDKNLRPPQGRAISPVPSPSKVQENARISNADSNPSTSNPQQVTQNQMSHVGLVIDLDDDSSSLALSERFTNERSKPTTPDEIDLESLEEAPPTARHTNSSHLQYPRKMESSRLEDDELPFTQIKVLTSTIRPNERGKEVLSFIISVGVANKQPWRIEKLYSNVLALDSRVRQMLHRSQVKRLASLPDSKLFKDNAPAKVDQRKLGLEHYLQSVAQAPVKYPGEICGFFNSDIMNETRAPVANVGYKEGYLTKRGKNFGGWKTRYFVLQGPVLEYYESRGGAHLGSISIAGAQIGRQQRNPTRDADDDNEYRHAFLVIEARKGTATQHVRHVLCAESDAERDSWVDVLVKYVMGEYDDGLVATTAQHGGAHLSSPPTRQSSESAVSSNQHQTPRKGRHPSKDDIYRGPGPAVPISQLSLDNQNAKLFQAAPLIRDSSSNNSPIDRGPSAEMAKRAIERAQMATNGISVDPQLSSSLPTGSTMDVAAQLGTQNGIARPTSEMGHYSDSNDNRLPQVSQQSTPARPDRVNRQSFMPGLATVNASPVQPASDRPVTPEGSSSQQQRVTGRSSEEQSGNPKISGPKNGMVLPSGYQFGPKEPPTSESHAERERDRKTKSTAFWRFGRDKPSTGVSQAATAVHAPVFGVSIQESLAVAEKANLPAVLFRCIQYLEAKKAEEEEGIYRLSGSSAVIKSLRERFNSEGDIDLLKEDEQWDPHAIAGLLKQFLRDLPSSILTRELHPYFLSVMDLSNPEERVNELSHIVAQLPIENYSLLRALTAHLILIVQNSAINKMTVRNVGIVFSPTLGIPAGVFSLMLGEFNKVFNVDGADSPVEMEQATDLQRRFSGSSRRNSRSYQDSATDQLLGLGGRSLPVTTESQSETEEELSVHDESGADTDDDEVDQTNSVVHPEAPGPAERDTTAPTLNISTSHVEMSESNQNTPVRTARSNARAASVAAERGLHISTNPNASKRYSRQVGLPLSPRPPASQPSTPLRSSSNPNSSI